MSTKQRKTLPRSRQPVPNKMQPLLQPAEAAGAKKKKLRGTVALEIADPSRATVQPAAYQQSQPQALDACQQASQQAGPKKREEKKRRNVWQKARPKTRSLRRASKLNQRQPLTKKKRSYQRQRLRGSHWPAVRRSSRSNHWRRKSQNKKNKGSDPSHSLRRAQIQS